VFEFDDFPGDFPGDFVPPTAEEENLRRSVCVPSAPLVPLVPLPSRLRRYYSRAAAAATSRRPPEPLVRVTGFDGAASPGRSQAVQTAHAVQTVQTNVLWSPKKCCD